MGKRQRQNKNGTLESLAWAYSVLRCGRALQPFVTASRSLAASHTGQSGWHTPVKKQDLKEGISWGVLAWAFKATGRRVLSKGINALAIVLAVVLMPNKCKSPLWQFSQQVWLTVLEFSILSWWEASTRFLFLDPIISLSSYPTSSWWLDFQTDGC